ncbi:hypothetical protein ACHHYP_01210 [Achlya hypogyna]|uniref:Uncharacterized protein n=1 Tax=Achlya hypogyna TaxID=1202772 RepID=A0A1V9Z925_ACHHY|nr:hypothetical protein ACHHYP_01210 [Achlya hypogyna]
MIQRLNLVPDRIRLAKLMSDDDSSESERSARVGGIPRDLTSPDFDRILNHKVKGSACDDRTTESKLLVDSATVVTRVTSNEYEDAPQDVYITDSKTSRGIGGSLHALIFGKSNNSKRSAPPPSPPTTLRHDATKTNPSAIVRKPHKSWEAPDPILAPADEETSIEAFS